MQENPRDLLRRAGTGFSTLSMHCHVEYDPALLGRAFQRAKPEMAGLVASGAMAAIVPEGVAAAAGASQRFRHDWLIWWRKPSCWRDDIVWENGGRMISIVCGTLSASYVSALRTLYTNQRPTRQWPRLRSLIQPRIRYELPTLENRMELVPLVARSFLAGNWELSVVGKQVYVGREAVRLLAARTDGSGPGLWDGVDEYEVLVDVRHGALLRVAGIVDGEEAGSFAAGAVRFDHGIPDDVFTFAPPPRTKVVCV
jgi:hypothetical protein